MSKGSALIMLCILVRYLFKFNVQALVVFIAFCYLDFAASTASAQSLNFANPERPASGTLSKFMVSSGSILNPLGGRTGNADNGAKIVQSREGQCTLCHDVPGHSGQVGNLAPRLHGVGLRLTTAQLRLRIVNSSLINPQTIMPSYYKTEGLVNVDPKWSGLPLLNDQQIEDVVAYLAGIR